MGGRGVRERDGCAFSLKSRVSGSARVEFELATDWRDIEGALVSVSSQ